MVAIADTEFRQRNLDNGTSTPAGMFMTRLPIYFVAVLGVILVGGIVFLATWEIPAPSGVVEKVIPDDRFPR